ncbi:MAG: hemerythrin domain-containing protein [Polaromonas sp.]|nr:hemerythrin domain-containing protein [Polaromonas sp.]
MAHLEWSDALSLDLPLMDDTHREFVDLLALVQGAPDAQLETAWLALIAHTDEHFGQEDRWMAATRFASSNCHSMQHKVVLQVMREGAVLAADGNLGAVRSMASELALWFPQHAQSMDAALALHLRRAGYDPLTGVVSRPEELPASLVEGCGSSACSDALPA